MKKTIFVSFLVTIFLPLTSFAALAVPGSPYANPATVTYTGADAANYMYLFLGDTQVATTNPNIPAASGTLNTLTWGSGSFNGTVAGNYELVNPAHASCVGLGYAACASANSGFGVPGTREADFTINTAPTPWLFSTSTTDQGEINLFDGFLVYFISFFGVIWLLRKH